MELQFNVEQANGDVVTALETPPREATSIPHERVGLSSPSPVIAMILQSGAGELFRAIHEGNVPSCLLLMRAGNGSCHQSTGASLPRPFLDLRLERHL